MGLGDCSYRFQGSFGNILTHIMNPTPGIADPRRAPARTIRILEVVEGDEGQQVRQLMRRQETQTLPPELQTRPDVMTGPKQPIQRRETPTFLPELPTLELQTQ
jgi:hypothetical protein